MSKPQPETVETPVVCAVHQLACPTNGCDTTNAVLASLSPTSTKFAQVSLSRSNHGTNRGFGPPPPLPPRSTRPDYVRTSGQRSVDAIAPPLTVVEVSDSDSDELNKDVAKLSIDQPLTVVDVSDYDSDDSAELTKNNLPNVNISTVASVPDSDALEVLRLHTSAQSANVTSTAKTSTSPNLLPLANTAKKLDTGISRLPSTSPNLLPLALRGTTDSRPSAKKSGSSASSSAQTPRRGKRVFYVVTKGRRTGVFDSWLYVDSLVKGIDSTYKSYKDKNEAIEDFLTMKGMGLVKQSGIYQPDLFPNAPEDLSAE